LTSQLIPILLLFLPPSLAVLSLAPLFCPSSQSSPRPHQTHTHTVLLSKQKNLKSKGLICLFRGLEKQARKGRSEGTGRWRLRVLELSEAFCRTRWTMVSLFPMLPILSQSGSESFADAPLITSLLNARCLALSLSSDLQPPLSGFPDLEGNDLPSIPTFFLHDLRSSAS
jgi:hypothetical protein